MFAAAVLAVPLFGPAPDAAVYDPPLGYLHPFGGWPQSGLFDTLAPPLAKWDSLWYLAIAQDGYVPSTLPGGEHIAGLKHAFFPLYPIVVRGVSITGDAATTMIAAYVVSHTAFLIALLCLHRLVTVELGPRYARPTVMLLAFAPSAYFFSAPYTESLFLALTLGAFLAARDRRWALAGVLAAACSATRNTGVLILLPLLLLYLYPTGHEGPAGSSRLCRLLPRRRPGLNVLWLGLAPLGLVAFSAYLGHAVGDPLAWRTAQDEFVRVEVTDPLSGAWEGIKAGIEALGPDWGSTFAPINAYNLAFLIVAVVATVGACKQLPAAYGAYVAVALLLPLSAPALGEPLRSLPRFLLVLFPIWMWLAVTSERRGWTVPLTGAFAVGLTLLTAAFATWHPWV